MTLKVFHYSTNLFVFTLLFQKRESSKFELQTVERIKIKFQILEREYFWRLKFEPKEWIMKTLIFFVSTIVLVSALSKSWEEVWNKGQKNVEANFQVFLKPNCP